MTGVRAVRTVGVHSYDGRCAPSAFPRTATDGLRHGVFRPGRRCPAWLAGGSLAGCRQRFRSGRSVSRRLRTEMQQSSLTKWACWMVQGFWQAGRGPGEGGVARRCGVVLPAGRAGCGKSTALEAIVEGLPGPDNAGSGQGAVIVVPMREITDTKSLGSRGRKLNPGQQSLLVLA